MGEQKHQKTSNVDDPLAQSAMPQPSILTSPSQPHQTIPAATSNPVDLDALEQAIMTKFSDQLNQAVAQQVQQATAPMQAEINKISQMLQYMSEQLNLVGLPAAMGPLPGTPTASSTALAPPPAPVTNYKVPPPVPNVNAEATTCLLAPSFSFQSLIAASTSSSNPIMHQAMAVNGEADA